jgi:hypothetical protein
MIYFFNIIIGFWVNAIGLKVGETVNLDDLNVVWGKVNMVSNGFNVTMIGPSAST